MHLAKELREQAVRGKGRVRCPQPNEIEQSIIIRGAVLEGNELKLGYGVVGLKQSQGTNGHNQLELSEY